MSSEARRVGIFSLLAILSLLVVVLLIRGADLFRSGYELTIVFKDAAGIEPGTVVRMSGVEIGEVKEVDLSPTNEARVGIRINDRRRWLQRARRTDIPQGSRFAIATTGLLGERYIGITPASAQSPPIPDGAEVRGDDPFTIERLAKRFEEIADQVSTLVQNANELLTDPELRADLRLALRNAREAAAIARATLTDAREVIGVARRAALNVEQTTVQVQRLVDTDAAEIAQNLKRMSMTLADTSQRLQKFMQDTTGDGEFSRDIRETATMLRDASGRIRQMAEDLQGVINKEDVARAREALHEARETVRDARAVVQRASTFLGQPDGGLSLRNFVTVEYQVWYTGTRAGHNLDATLLPAGARFYRLGLHDIGVANTLVLQIGGRLNPSLAWRAGVYESQVGVGLDYRAFDPFTLSLDLYNANLPTLDAVGKYQVAPNWRIIFGGRNLLRQPGLVFGAGASF